MFLEKLYYFKLKSKLNHGKSSNDTFEKPGFSVDHFAENEKLGENVLDGSDWMYWNACGIWSEVYYISATLPKNLKWESWLDTCVYGH